MATVLVSCLLSGALLIIILQLKPCGRRSTSHREPYPPGPPGNCILGNLQDLPTSYAWLSFTEWGKKYGNLIHFSFFGKSTLVVNSYEDCVELMVKRSAIYSSRSSMVMADLMGWSDINLAFFPYNSRHKLHRRLFQQSMKTDKLLTYRSIQNKKVLNFLNDLLSSPEDFLKHCRTLPGAIILSIVYGHDVATKDDYYVKLAERAIGMLSEGYAGYRVLFDVLPIIRYIPSWLPGAAFKRFVLEGRALAYEMRDLPFENIVKKMKDGRAPICFATELLESCQSDEERLEISNVCAAAYAGGTDTSSSVLSTFFLAMAMFPDAQNKGRWQIENVVGSARLVTFSDLPSLPYIEAILREALRWRPITPLSITHSTTEDDVYKGCAIVPNVWAIAHNPDKYPEPDAYNPDRFFNKDGVLNGDCIDYIFGFGRRYCPGSHLATSTLLLAFALVLQNFTIDQSRDIQGREIPVKANYKDGLIMHPFPFECSIKPRSAEAQNIILEATGKNN